MRASVLRQACAATRRMCCAPSTASTSTLAQGEALGLVGESGCGKSTLGRCIVGLYQPTAGEIRFDGDDARRGTQPAERRGDIQIVFQDPYSSLNPRMTVQADAGRAAARARIVVPDRIDASAAASCSTSSASASAPLDAYPRQFSGGQRQRVSIARALALEPDVLVADEPVSALDVSVQATVLNLLEELRERARPDACCFIAHNLAVVRHVCDRVAVMYLGRIVEDGADRRAVRRSAPSVHAGPALRPSRDSSPDGHPRRSRSSAIRRARSASPPAAASIRAVRSPSRSATELDPALTRGQGAATHAAACHFAWTSKPAEHTPEVELDAGEA